jgi:predicted amidophosphoribosyltransferase
VLSGLIDLLWPRICPVCSDEVGVGDGATLVHDACLWNLPPARLSGQGRIPVHARFDDGEPWFALLHAWKYGGQRGLARPVARAMAARAPVGGSRCVIVPMPDDPGRRLQRGYSPVLDLAVALSGIVRADCDTTLLRRPVVTRSQTACLDDEARSRNLEGVLRTGDLSRRHHRLSLVLVDDQITSGASVRSAAGLLAARGHRVVVWCAARASRAPTGLA